MKKRARVALVAASATLLTIAFGPGVALAMPHPESGPPTGGTTVTLDTPYTRFSSVSGGGTFVVALGEDGETYSWGNGGQGQLGNGSATTSTLPIKVDTPNGVKFTNVSSSYFHSVALGNDGNTYAWGYSNLGNNSTAGSNVPVKVQMPDGIHLTSVSAGWAFSMGIGDDGKTYGWGLAPGHPKNEAYLIPTPANLPDGIQFSQISAAINSAGALDTQGNAYTWSKATGELERIEAPVGVKFKTISAGKYLDFFVALGDDGNAYSWGDNSRGSLGDGSTTDSSTPVLIERPVGVSFTQLTAGMVTAEAIGDDGKAYQWGGVGLHDFKGGSSTPVEMKTFAGVTYTSVTSSYVGGHALGDDGKVYSWGSNASGQFGAGNLNPLPANMPAIPANMIGTVHGVTFGGEPATAPVDNSNGTFSVTTPPHRPGLVDVVMEWSPRGGAVQLTKYANAFNYEPQAPTVSDPDNVTVAAGKSATFSVKVTGDPAPKVYWEVSSDKGESWSRLSASPREIVSPEGLSLTVKSASVSDNGKSYRAIATNDGGTVASGSATLTVTASETNANPGGPDNGHGKHPTGDSGGSGASSGGPHLANTGSDSAATFVSACAFALIVAGTLVFFLARRKRRSERVSTEI